MPRRLDVVQELLRSPCKVDIASLPRSDAGFGCADCGRTVVDVAALTLDEVVTLRRRAQSGAERICAAYTLERNERVVLRASPNSPTLIAVAIGVLLTACETGSTQSAHDEHLDVALAAPSQNVARPPTPSLLSAPSSEAVPSTSGSAPPPQTAALGAKLSGAPPCDVAHAPKAKRASAKVETRIMGGY